MSAAPDRGRPLANRALPGLLFCLFVVAVYSPTLFSRRNFAGRDLLVYHLPIEKAIHGAWSRGRVPVWISEISGGRPLAANPNAGAFYPVRPLLARTPFPVAIKIFPILHWALAGLGVLLLIRSVGGSHAASWVGAVTYALSGPAVSEVFYPNIQPGMTLLPWIVWAIERRSSSEGARLLVLSLLFGLLFLAGDVFTVGIAIGSAVLWILVEREPRRRASELALLVLALLLAGLLAAPQIVATALWVGDTSRAVLTMKLRESLSFSISPFRLLELVVPFPFGPTWSLDNSLIWGLPVFHWKSIGFFSTLHAGAFGLIALASSRHWRAPGARFARILFVLTLLVSVVPGFAPLRWAELPSPLPLRFPEKFAVALVFALAILAGVAFDRFRAAVRGPRSSLGVAALLTAAALAASVFPERAGALVVRLAGSPPLPPGLDATPTGLEGIAARELAPALAEAGLLWVLTLVALDRLVRPGRASVAIAAALLTLSPLAANRRIARTVRADELLYPTAFARFLERSDPAGEYRALGESLYREMSSLELAQKAADLEGGGDSWFNYRQALKGRGTVFNLDFDVGDFARVESLRQMSPRVTRDPRASPFFGNLALRWGIRYRDQEPIHGYAPVGGTGVETWDELPGALPDVRLSESWREETGFLAAAGALPEVPLGEIVLETGTTGRGRARAGSVRLLEKTPERLALESEAPDPTWLFVLRGFWNHREVLVDGRPVECVPAQLAFSAVPIPPGRHAIEWKEKVPGLEVSRYGPLLAAILLALLLIRDRRRRSVSA